MKIVHGIWRVLKPVIEIVLAIVGVLVLVLVLVLVPHESSSNVVAVNDALTGYTGGGARYASGPLIGDQSAIPTEVKCMQSYAADSANYLQNYAPSIGAAEHANGQHTGVQACATFTGNLNGQNQVYEQQSATNYGGSIGLVVFDGPNNGYLMGGAGTPSPGQFVAKFDPATGQQIWRTYLQNLDTANQWLAAGSMAVEKDGSVVAAAGPWLYRLDPVTGAILASAKQPILSGPATDANFDGMQIAQDKQGAILLKSQNRVPSCTIQGNQAMSNCTPYPNTVTNTTVIAANPVTMKNIDAIALNQEIVARPVLTTYKSKEYMYMAGTKNIVRVIWDPATQKLTQDTSWAPSYLLKGEGPGDAPTPLNNWIIADTNGGPSTTTPECAVAVSQANPNDSHRICPWGTTMPMKYTGGTTSETPGSLGTDPQNSMIYIQDWLGGGIFGIRLNQSTGDMNVAWKRTDWRSSDYFTLIGPASHRVLVNQYLNPNFTKADAPGYNYTEKLVWANAATGKTIAQGSYGPSTFVGSLPNIGYGGRVYMMGNNGALLMYQVVPCSAGKPVGSTSTGCGSPEPASNGSPSPSSSG